MLYRGWKLRAKLHRGKDTNPIEAEYGGGWNELSTWYFDEDNAFGGGDALFPEGFDQLTRHLARGVDVRLSRQVRNIAPEKRACASHLPMGWRCQPITRSSPCHWVC